MSLPKTYGIELNAEKIIHANVTITIAFPRVSSLGLKRLLRKNPNKTARKAGKIKTGTKWISPKIGAKVAGTIITPPIISKMNPRKCSILNPPELLHFGFKIYKGHILKPSIVGSYVIR
jgi:hypothetical protein